MSFSFFLRLIGAVLLALLGWQVSTTAVLQETIDPRLLSLFPLLGALLGLAFAPPVASGTVRWAANGLAQLPTRDLLAGIAGLFVGLLVTALLAIPLSMLPGLWGSLSPIVAGVILSILGITALVMHSREIFPSLGLAGLASLGRRNTNPPIILDTSAIIDGRIADINQTGFIQGTLVIPRFVLNELQHIADSPDALRRNRGRRGLDILNKLQKESGVPIQISDVDFDDITEVDAKLVELSKAIKAPIVTNDFNLNRVAELQGVRVLNVNMLANAVKSVVLPGEEMAIQIIQEGKELGQGVGFLDDGTMVVVEGGRKYLNQQLEITVTRVLTTVAGRMIFAHPKNGASASNGGEGRR